MVLLMPAFLRWFKPGFLAVPWLRLGLACAAMQATFWLIGMIEASRGLILVAGGVAGTLAFFGVLLATGVLHPSRVSAMLAGGHETAEPPTAKPRRDVRRARARHPRPRGHAGPGSNVTLNSGC